MTAGEGERPEDLLDRLLTGQRHGPHAFEDAGAMTPLAETAGRLARLRHGIPASSGQSRAFLRMMDEVEAARLRPAPKGLRVLVAAWLTRPVVRSAAAAMMAIVVVSGAGLGVAAATGSGQPVREFLRISSESAIKVEFTGVVLAIEGSELQIDAGGDVRAAVLGPGTAITRDGAAALAADIAPGQLLEVRGRLRADNRIDATRIDIQGVAVSPTAGVPTEPAASPQPTISVPGFVPGSEDDPGDAGAGEREGLPPQSASTPEAEQEGGDDAATPSAGDGGHEGGDTSGDRGDDGAGGPDSGGADAEDRGDSGPPDDSEPDGSDSGGAQSGGEEH